MRTVVKLLGAPAFDDFRVAGEYGLFVNERS